MAKSESNVVNQIMIAASKSGATTWKNVRGFFYTLDMQRKISAGIACKGSSDLVGLKSVIIQQEDVGKVFARFVAIEVKTTTGRASSEQQQFIAFVNKSGGLGAVCRSEADAIKLLS